MQEHTEKCIVVGFLIQSMMCFLIIYKQFPPKQHIVPRIGNKTQNYVYQFHDEMLPDSKVLEGDDNEGTFRLRPTESPQLQHMRIKLYSLNYAQGPADEPELIQIIRDYWIRWPSKQQYSLINSFKTDYSAKGQSLIVDNLLGHQTHGFFIECGAFDGESGSNTLFFERQRNWTGLLIEADALNYRQMTRKNRKAFISPACLGIYTYPTVMSFNRAKNRGRLIDRYRTFTWIRSQGLKLKQAESQCFPFYSFILALNRTAVDYLSLDVEGIEYEVLKTIPFKNLNIRIVSVKYIFYRSFPLRQFMESNGYKTVYEFKNEKNQTDEFIFQKI